MAYIAPFQFTGLASGFDWKAVVDRLMEIERRPVDLLRMRQKAFEDKLFAWQSIASVLGDLKAKLEELGVPDAFYRLAAVSSDPAVLSASAGSGATAGVHTVEVRALALNQTVASDSQPDGSLGLSGTFEVNGRQVEVTSADTLADIADKINRANAGVVAWVVDGRLVVRSLTPGTAGALSMRDVSGTVLQTLGVLGSGNLAFRASYLKSVAPDPLYPDGGGEFTDGLEGTDITDGLSFGYSGTDLGVPGGGPATVEVTVDLGQVANLTGVKLVSGGGPNSSYCADSLEVLTSTDGVNFVSQGSVSGANARQLTLAFTTQARYVKFRITKNFAPADQPGDWLFLDEGYVYGTGFKNLLQPAQDASVVVDGIDVKRGSNVISDAVPGVTLSLKGTGSATVTVQPDVQAVAGEIEAVIKAYNAVLDRLGTVLAKGAVLQGDTSAVGIQVALRRLVSGYADKLRELGIASALDGKLSVDAGKLADALQRDPAAVRAVFFNSERTGLGDRLLAMLGGWIGITGSIQSTESSLNRTISSIREQIETLERRLEVRRQVLTARFLEMERALTLLQSQVADLSRLAVQQ